MNGLVVGRGGWSGPRDGLDIGAGGGGSEPSVPVTGFGAGLWAIGGACGTFANGFGVAMRGVGAGAPPNGVGRAGCPPGGRDGGGVGDGDATGADFPPGHS